MNKITEYLEDQLSEFREISEEEEISFIVKRVNNSFKEAQCKYFYAGGFDSPGYDIECYIIAYLEEGIIKGRDIQIERY